MQDSIERSIVINASLKRVWDLIVEPGWWIPSPAPMSVESSSGAVIIREYEGRSYPVEVVNLEPRRYASFRWASGFPDEDLIDDRATLVEFQLEQLEASVQVTVVESGFAGLVASSAVRQKNYDDNCSGWTGQLKHLKGLCEAFAST